MGQQVFPKDVKKTRLSKRKYFYIKGIDDVELPGGEKIPQCKWTAEDLMEEENLTEFLEDAFKIADILGGAFN